MRTSWVVLVMLVAACSSDHLPAKWDELGITQEQMTQVEPETDENGLYIEYRGRSREELLASVQRSLLAADYTQSRTAFDGDVLGFERRAERLVVKVDQFGDSLHLAIFNERGQDPLLHAVIFGKYTLGPAATGEAAKKQLLEELEKP